MWFEQLMETAAARFDSDHRFTINDLLWLHQFWLDGVFTWAGTYRNVNIGKGGFMFAAAAHVPELMRQFEKDQLALLLSVLMALQAGLPPLDFSELQGAKREAYFAAVRAGMDRNYQPMVMIFAGVIERTFKSCGS